MTKEHNTDRVEAAIQGRGPVGQQAQRDLQDLPEGYYYSLNFIDPEFDSNYQNADLTDELLEWVTDPVNYLNYNKLKIWGWRMPNDPYCPNFRPQLSFEQYCPNFDFDNSYKDLDKQPSTGTPMKDLVFNLWA